MFAIAEQRPFYQPEIELIPRHNHGKEKSCFSISSTYTREALPSQEMRLQFTESSRPFNLWSTFKYGLLELVKIHGREKGITYAALSVVLNMLALQQEMLGKIDTNDIINLVRMDTLGNVFFVNDHFGQAYSIEETLEEFAKEDKNAIVRARYRRENKQIIAILRALTEKVAWLMQPMSDSEFIAGLNAAGFHKETITLTPSFVIGVPGLREKYLTIEAIQNLVDNPKKVTVWVGPKQALSISPPHWVHRQGETGFIWMSECLVFEETRDVIVRQSGKFGASDEQSLVKYLSYGQKETKVFNNEDDLMEFVNLISSAQYSQPKVLLDFLVDQLGGIHPVGKIDRQIATSKLSIVPFFNAIQEIYELELDACTNTSEDIVQSRLEAFSDLLRHQIARNEPKALSMIVRKYTEDAQKVGLNSKNDFATSLQRVAVLSDPGFGIQIDFSLLDCVAGSPLSFASKFSSMSGSMVNPNLSIAVSGVNGEQMYLTSKQAELLAKYPRSPFGARITTPEELHEFCEAFHKKTQRYATRGVCGMCHKETFVWSPSEGGCGVCPVCEVWDVIKAVESQGKDRKKAKTDERKNPINSYRSTIGVGDFVASATSGSRVFTMATFLNELEFLKKGVI